MPESQRADAANSLVYEANVRLRDPIYGCVGAISALQQQIQSLQADLNAIRAEIARYKYREVAVNTRHVNNIASTLVSSGCTEAAQLSTVPEPPTPPPPRPSIVISSSSSLSSSSSVNLYSTSTVPNNNLSSYFA